MANPIIDPIELEKVNISSKDVISTMIKSQKYKTIFWKFIIRPILFILGVLCALGIVYLWTVPLTNVIGKALFADFICGPNDTIWGVCGRAINDRSTYKFDINGTEIPHGFFVFLLIQSSLGLIIMGLCIMIFVGKGIDLNSPYFCKDDNCCSDVSCGQFCGNTSIEYCCPFEKYPSYYSDKDKNKKSWCHFINGTIIFSIGILISTIIVGIWVGRAAAVISVPSCLPYKDTSIGFYGCVDPTNNAYVGGQECKNCAGIGFGIIGIPLIIVELLVMLFIFIFRRCKNIYKETKAQLTRDAVMRRRDEEKQREKEERLNDIPAPPAINMSDFVEDPNLIVLPTKCELCAISEIDRQAQLKLDCKHVLCKECAIKSNEMCPFCRAKFIIK